MAKIQLGEVLSLPAVVPEWPMGRNLPSPAHQCSQGFRWVALDGRSDSFHVLSTQPVASVKSESQDRTQLARCGPVAFGVGVAVDGEREGRCRVAESVRDGVQVHVGCDLETMNLPSASFPEDPSLLPEDGNLNDCDQGDCAP